MKFVAPGAFFLSTRRTPLIEAEGITLDEPYRKIERAGAAITYIIDPSGARVELVQLGP